jgi:hypothetical protein
VTTKRGYGPRLRVRRWANEPMSAREAKELPAGQLSHIMAV